MFCSKDNSLPLVAFLSPNGAHSTWFDSYIGFNFYLGHCLGAGKIIWVFGFVRFYLN